MKRILILIFIAAMFCSCKKQSGPEGTYDGTFQTNDRNAQGQMVSTSRAASVDVQKVDNDYISISGDQFVYRTTDQNRVTYSSFQSEAYFNLSFTTIYIHTNNPGVGTDSYFSGTKK